MTHIVKASERDVARATAYIASLLDEAPDTITRRPARALKTRHAAAAAYGLIKQRLADRFPQDANAYYDIKDPVFDIIVEEANSWAALT